MHSRPLFRAACILALGLTLSACGGDGEGPAKGGGDRPTMVTTTVVQPRAWNDTVQALGTVKAHESVTVTAKVSETVDAVHFDSGDVVARGAALVTLSGRQQQAALAEAQASADEAQRLFKRQEELAAQQLIARASLDSQRATRDAANARVAQIRANLGDRVIRAPFSGVLGLRQVSPGALVTPGTVITTLDDTSRVYVDFPVPEAALGHVASGQRVSGTSVAWPGRTFDGTVATVDSRLDEATRALVVRGDFHNPDRALRPGMLLQVTLSRPERQALLLPEIAVVQVGNASYVFRVGADGKAERADVKVGVRRDGLAEIVEGLAAGDRVVVDGTGKLRPGATVVEAQGGPEKAGASPATQPAAEGVKAPAPQTGASAASTSTPARAKG
ncbi:efflux RND transporter periplasmic adaptor subunit [Aerolutibacter ruishenii]|uniref:Membrane fusion protein (Multidrug efflux system) n=1 Tax=Aerolutibacter ruishenii TaxID=686800 RepID=A0A562LK18_9GAMM|nr:efflux RND transporter periplasmic adaptor subunit [Lysobacter ruishenii]TWI07980.1 membrane fusion protein (multidrug efflux system) [Lysobacter ruishenii]